MCRWSSSVPARACRPRLLTRTVTTFFFPPVRRSRTTLVPSLLRPEILAAGDAPGEHGDHLLVYQTAEGNEGLPAALAATGFECRVYGFRRELMADVRDGRLLYRPFDERGFIDDLRTARGVVTGGGYTLMSECVHLGLPALSLAWGDADSTCSGTFGSRAWTANQSALGSSWTLGALEGASTPPASPSRRDRPHRTR